ncbi:MAG: cysteine-rich small domain-containing protein [Lachnospiraceae bacterium]|nr:cysteine-rich small domain-containing protein [Lachnospiraceae bacterium]
MEHYKFFQNRECEYFPCHDMEHLEEFNCLFCYCPLYGLKDQCGGNFRYTKKGVKDCSHCLLPHGKCGYEHVMGHIKGVLELGER